MAKTGKIIGLDVGEKRIGVALFDGKVRIAVPMTTLIVDGSEIKAISEIFHREQADMIVIGYPRNQSGEPTQQTGTIEAFRDRLTEITSNLVFQDESLTSVMAEQQLVDGNRAYTKADIDAGAAALILQDYLESHHG